MPGATDSSPGGPAFVMTGEDQRIARLAGGTLAFLGTCSLVGVAFSMYLVNHQPLLLIAMSPIGRHLLLVAPITNPVAFVAVAVGRRMLFYLGSFHLGGAVGPPGVVWIEARARRFGRFVRWLERLFERWSRTVVFVAAGPTVSALAGIAGMRRSVFLSLAAAGLTLRMIALVYFAEWLRGPIEALLAWIDAHWIPGTIVMVILVGAYQARRIAQLRRAPPPGFGASSGDAAPKRS